MPGARQLLAGEAGCGRRRRGNGGPIRVRLHDAVVELNPRRTELWAKHERAQRVQGGYS